MTHFQSLIYVATLAISLSISLCAVPHALAAPACEIFDSSPIEIEADFQKTFQAQMDADRTTLTRMQTEPAAFYLELRRKAREELKNGADDFHFEPYRPIVERISLDLKQRQTRKFGTKYEAQLEALHQEARELLKEGAPLYRKTIRFIMNKYLPLLDQILGERHPELLANNFHKRNAEHLLEEFLSHAPNLLLHFSFASRGNRFFIESRSSLFQFVGVSLKGLDDQERTPFADNFPMKNSEFTWHDLGHVDFMAFRDLQYILSSHKPIERVVEEWDVTRTRITPLLDETSDRDLADAMDYILMELLHERGFQYSLTVLKTELETPKWTDVILRKRAAGFYDHFKHNPRMFHRLEEARRVLLKTVIQDREDDQRLWFNAIRADRVSAKFTYTPTLIYKSGQLVQIKIDKALRAHVVVESEDGSLDTTSIREMISAQVNPTQNSPLVGHTLRQIESFLAAPKVESISLSPTREISVHLVNGQTLSLAQATQEITLHPGQTIEALEVFKINQALGSSERQEPVSFTVRKPTSVLIGKAKLGDDSVLRLTTDQGEITLPLRDTRIDPLHNLDLED